MWEEPAAHHHKQGRQTDIPQHSEGMPKLYLPGAVRSQANGQKVMYRHIWQEALYLAEQIHKTDTAKDIYAMRKQTIERVFVDRQGQTRYALYTSSWLGSCHTMGHA